MVNLHFCVEASFILIYTYVCGIYTYVCGVCALLCNFATKTILGAEFGLVQSIQILAVSLEMHRR